MAEKKKKDRWRIVRNTTIAVTPDAPGVWKRKEGGHAVRARVRNPATGKQEEIWKVLPDSTLAQAITYLEERKTQIKAGGVRGTQPSVRFGDFAVSLLKRKIAAGDLKSTKTQQRWLNTLEHLIGGTEGTSGLQADGLGDYYLDQLRPAHVQGWRDQVAQLVAAGDYTATSVNGWMAILRVVMKAARRELELPTLATEHLENLRTDDHATYSEEEPNALTAEEVGPFLKELLERFPQHYAMVFLGLMTGLRPSSMRPLRRRGASPDVQWESGRLLVRQSQTVGDHVMTTTKQGTRYAIQLPVSVLAVLRWHVQHQLTKPEQRDSDLLFPSVTGGFRSPTVLNKPLADVAQAIGLGKQFTQRGLRRTFNDLSRLAQVHDLVIRSISGHHTERMQHHYSTVAGPEQAAALEKVAALVGSAPPEVGSTVPESSPPVGSTTAESPPEVVSAPPQVGSNMAESPSEVGSTPPTVGSIAPEVGSIPAQVGSTVGSIAPEVGSTAVSAPPDATPPPAHWKRRWRFAQRRFVRIQQKKNRKPRPLA